MFDNISDDSVHGAYGWDQQPECEMCGKTISIYFDGDICQACLNELSVTKNSAWYWSLDSHIPDLLHQEFQ